MAKFEASLSELPAFRQTDVADLTDLAHAAGPTGQSAHTMHRISDLAAELGPQYEETLREAGLSAALIVPLGSPQAPMAVLEFYRGAPVPSPKELSDVMAGVTGQLNAAIDRKGSENALVTAKNAFEDALRAKSEFVASISHEVRTPMNGVIGMTSLLADSKLTVEQKECVDTIGHCAEGLLAVVSNTLISPTSKLAS